MPLQATSGAASYDAFGGGVPVAINYIEDVFNVWLHTGSSSSNQTITNGIDLAGKGGLVWQKGRNTAFNHAVFDSGRSLGLGTASMLNTNTTNAEATGNSMRFDSTGFTMGVSDDAAQWASWTFRKQKKFFDVVTWTGDGSNKTISHSLGSTPGCIIVKRTDTTSNWRVYHRSLSTPNENWMHLNTTDAAFGPAGSNIWNVTSTTFQADTYLGLSTSGGTYVAYLFAHDAGGFGLTGTDNVISCGSYTGNGSATGPVVTLGYEPQWVMVKRATVSTGSWEMYDSMRGFTMEADAVLRADTSGAEFSLQRINPTSTGFQLADSDGDVNANGSTYIYIAIRRGPMKVPTDATKVFSPIAYTGNGGTQNLTTNFAGDMAWIDQRNLAGQRPQSFDKLRGATKVIYQSSTSAEETNSPTSNTVTFNNTQTVLVGPYSPNGIYNDSGQPQIAWNFQRAPSFFDEVCYTGVGGTATFSHNLGVVPELMIVKRRSAGGAWMVNSQYIAADARLELQSTSAVKAPPDYGDAWNNTRPTSTVFTVSTDSDVNASGGTYVNYLFATCAGVSKCTAFTGTGTLQTINCGFTSGARFVLIKRTDSTGDWYVWDSSRGLSSSTDPYLLLNSTAAEVTSTNWVDTTSTGFQVTAASGNNVNINGASYIALAIA